MIEKWPAAAIEQRAVTALRQTGARRESDGIMKKQPHERKRQPRNGEGRPAHQPDARNRQTVEALGGFGIPQAKIAQVLGIDHKTLLKYYGDELDRGAAQVEAKLVGNLLRISSGTDAVALKALIFALRCRFGWSEYAPMRTEALGKKEQLTIAAETAHVGSEWSDLLQ